MDFEIKGFKDWQSNEGGGYQFNLYFNKRKFAWVHNAGEGGMIDMTFADSDSTWKDSPFKSIWDEYVKSLGQWKSSFSEDSYDYCTDTAIGEMVEQYEFAKVLKKARKKGVPFRLLADPPLEFSTVTTLDPVLAQKWLDDNYPNNYELL